MRLAVRIALVATAMSLGALFAIGSIIAAMLERDGFTSASADGARPGYLILLAVGLFASITVPTALAIWAFPDDRRTLMGTGAVVLLAALALFGLAAA